MPRIEIIPLGWETSKDKSRGDGTPTIDVCEICSIVFMEDVTLDECERLLENPGKSDFPGAMVGSVLVSHPPYDDGHYHCEYCDEELTEDDE